jgi:hypothetical protein
MDAIIYDFKSGINPKSITISYGENVVNRVYLSAELVREISKHNCTSFFIKELDKKKTFLFQKEGGFDFNRKHRGLNKRTILETTKLNFIKSVADILNLESNKTNVLMLSENISKDKKYLEYEMR